MAKIYDIHLHLFDKTVLDREVAGLAVMLSTFINVPDNETRRLKQVLGNVDEFLSRVGSNGAQEIYDSFNAPYDTHFPQDTKVYTPLTFDLTFADKEDLKNTIGDKWLLWKRDRGLEILTVLSDLISKIAPRKKDVDFKNLSRGVSDLIKAIRKKDDLINSQNFETQVSDMEALVDKYGSDHIMPFYCVEPRQARKTKDPVDFEQKLTDKVLNGKFRGVKLYSTTGFSPTDPVLFNAGGVYDFCDQHRIPITSHNSNGGFGTFGQRIYITGHVYNEDTRKVKYYNNERIKFRYNVLSANAGKAVSERAEALNHPHLWKLVLDKYPNLTLNLAHFGGASSVMELVHHELPENIRKISTSDFTSFFKVFPAPTRAVMKSYYTQVVTDTEDNYELKSNLFDVRNDDYPAEAEEKNKRRTDYWNALYAYGKINNWAMHHLQMIQSDKYPNFYVDLSAFTAGHLFHYELPEDSLPNASVMAIRATITDPNDRLLFDNSFDKVPGPGQDFWWKPKKLDYPDQLRMVIIFRNADFLDKKIDDELDLVKKILNTDDKGLVNYLSTNDKFSILIDLYHFKTLLYDKLQQKHKEKILYGSDFYFTQVFGPRHEQYVEDFKAVFGNEFQDIANKHCEKFLNIA